MKWIVLLLMLFGSAAFAQDPFEDPTEIYVNGSGVPAGDLNLDGGKKLILEGGAADTFLYSSADNTFNWYSNNVARMQLSATILYLQNGVNLNLVSGASVIYSGGAALSLGSAGTTSHSLVTGDVIFGAGAAVEFDDAVYFDSSSTFASTLKANDNISILVGGGGDAGMIYLTTQTPNSAALMTSVDSNAFILMEKADVGYDFAHALQTNPTWFLQSANQSADEWLSMTHDQTNGAVGLGKGNLKIISSNGKGSASYISTKTESVTFPGGGAASQITTGSIIPAGAFVIGVSTRVTTTATTCTSVDIGIAAGGAADTDGFADGTAVAAGTTTTTSDGNSGVNYNTIGDGIIPSMAAQEITVTAVGGNCVNGVWAITVHYMGVTAATSN